MTAENPVALKHAVMLATVTRFREIATDYQRTQGQITTLQNHLTKLSEAAQDCHSTARLFGFDLVAAAAATAHHEAQQTPQVEMPPPAPAVTQRPRKIKDYVLEAAKQAYPNPVRATLLRKHLEEQGVTVHEKTMGMTLYRLSTQGLIKREGRDWFFVPNPHAEQDEENPGNEPGLL
jgi:hypothetical protein